jgi:hypothetical protein
VIPHHEPRVQGPPCQPNRPRRPHPPTRAVRRFPAPSRTGRPGVLRRSKWSASSASVKPRSPARLRCAGPVPSERPGRTAPVRDNSRAQGSRWSARRDHKQRAVAARAGDRSLRRRLQGSKATRR